MYDVYEFEQVTLHNHDGTYDSTSMMKQVSLHVSRYHDYTLEIVSLK